MKPAPAQKPRIRIAVLEGDPLRFVGFRMLFETENDLEILASSIPETDFPRRPRDLHRPREGSAEIPGCLPHQQGDRLSAGGGPGIWVKVGDISLSGCYLQTSEPLNVGHRATLLIKVANTQIRANGVVRFSDSTSGMGIGFTYLSAAERRKLTRLIAQLEHADAVTDNKIEPGKRP